jgi:hypothetical protein
VKSLLSILFFVPWLASCEHPMFHVFEPRVSGVPVRTPEARSRLRAAVADVAGRHQLVKCDPSVKLIGDPAGTLVSYGQQPGSLRSLGMTLFRDHSSGTDKVQLMEWGFTWSEESKAVEREIQASLP